MGNLTLNIDDVVLRKARIRALEQGTSVNALVRAYLGAFVGEGEEGPAVRRFLELGKQAKASSGPPGRAWSRDELHER